MSTVYVTVGIPAAGKTTWARRWVAKNPDTVIVSRDDVRAAHGWVSGFDENRVTRIHRAQIEAALLEGLDVVVADTNINKTFRNRLIKFCHEHGADVVIVPLKISLDEAILRDSKRESHRVGPDIVNKFYQQLQGQDLNMDEETYLPVQTFDPYVHATEGRRTVPAIIVDIDGTVAKHWNRNPYEYKKVGDDKPIEDVIEIIRLVKRMGVKLIFVSGRDDSCKWDTSFWLDQHLGFKDYTLFMRKTGDMRPDWIIKNEIYDEFIIPHYKILMVFDDRDQVVRHLRKRGITVAQVAPGRF